MAGDDGILVMKFGGTSMADADRMRQVGRIIAKASAPKRVVVASAMAGVTDTLLDACRAASLGNESLVRAALDRVESRHLEVIDRLGQEAGVDAAHLAPLILAECAALRTVLTSVTVLQ